MFRVKEETAPDEVYSRGDGEIDGRSDLLGIARGRAPKATDTSPPLSLALFFNPRAEIISG